MLVTVINALFTVFYVLILARVLFSWIRPNDYNSPFAKIGRTVRDLTDPFMRPLERLIPPIGGLDFSPMILLLVGRFVQGLILNLVR